MRTNVTIDDDIAEAISQRRRRSGQTLSQVVNALLRAGLRADAARREQPYRSATFPLRLRPGVSPDRLNELVDELEAARYREGPASPDG